METWDTIIVGAGSAGCVVANRLSADSSHKVLLLEAGGSDRRLWVRLPIGYARTFRDPRVNWMYTTEPEPALGQRRSYWPRGKLLGGSGSINAMAYVRGLPQDFDGWLARGNSGWGWQDVLPFFRRVEGQSDGAGSHLGSDGPLPVERIDGRVHPLCASFLAGAQELGYARIDDFNAPSANGVGLYRITTRNGWRASTASAFLRPALRRGNLRVLQRAHVLRVLMADRRAVGVEYRRDDGQVVRASARVQVILCGGAVNSPQLLQLSGIGDAGQLSGLGVPVAAHLPGVGQGLQDHLHITHVYRSRVPTLNDELGPWTGKLRAALQFIVSRRGALSMGVNQAGGFVAADPALALPEYQLYFNPASYTTRAERGQRLLQPDPYSGFSMSVHACRPTSRGSICVASNDALQAPRIVPNYLSTQRDLDQALAGARLLRQLAGTAALQAVIVSETLPGEGCRTDAALLSDFRARADTIFHSVGSCGMGPSACTAVVDSRLRVHGVAGLRVVDAAIFPTITSGNTNAPTIMVAEIGAQMVLDDMAGA